MQHVARIDEVTVEDGKPLRRSMRVLLQTLGKIYVKLDWPSCAGKASSGEFVYLVVQLRVL